MSATTGIGNLLLSELQSLSTEARRKHPEIKEASRHLDLVARSLAVPQQLCLG
ncbi:hypothetical protein FBU59_000662 [Linderina macrospora]|uniref:Uncharacterized protein n=1 Tax=Linderina macrospora TaxID=4868 RepID=A0ACC1JGE3_9FUNG|nr:hypothetical protein FBU59_000662 [Linderina macrospora]